jgi:hypothetical protein
MFPVSSKIWLVNVVLAAAVVLAGIMALEVWTQPDEAVPETGAAAETEAPPPDNKPAERLTSPESTYGVVAEKNLLSPDRSDPLAPGPGQGKPRLSEKMIFLYGVVTLDGQAQALVSDPESGSKAAGTKAGDKWVRVGDRIGNFSVAEIARDRIVLKDGTEKYDVLLYDEGKPVSLENEPLPPAAAPTVVVTGPDSDAQASPAAPDEQVARPAAGKTPAAQDSHSSPAFTPGSPAESGEKSGEYKIVNTPFGPIKRRVE